jgi:hypothetical protein
VAARARAAKLGPMHSPITIDTIQDPDRYTAAQLDGARRIAQRLGRGRLVLCEPPRR